MTEVLAHDGTRRLTGAAAAAQRLSDALRIQAGSYPFARGVGSRLADLIDRPLSPDTEAAIYAAVADAIRETENDLGDVRLRAVRVAADPRRAGAVLVDVDAWWLPAPAGEATPITARAALDPAGAAHPRPAQGYVPHTFVAFGKDSDSTRTGRLVLTRGGLAAREWTTWAQSAADAAPTGNRGGVVWDADRSRLLMAFTTRWWTMALGPDGRLDGSFTPRGSAWGIISALVAVRGRLLAIVGDHFSAVDPETFAVEPQQRDVPQRPRLTGLAWDGATLWGASDVEDALVVVDPDTGRIVRTVGPFGPGATYPRGLAWDPGSETLLLFDRRRKLLLVDRATGAAAGPGVEEAIAVPVGLTAVPTHRLPA